MADSCQSIDLNAYRSADKMRQIEIKTLKSYFETTVSFVNGMMCSVT